MTDSACEWEAIHGFTSSMEFIQFCSWLASQIDNGWATKSDSSESVEKGGEFICLESKEKWELIPPGEHSYGFWGPINEPHYPWPDLLIIKSPLQFKRLLNNLKYWVSTGGLKQTEMGKSGVPALPIEGISEIGPWPDYLEAYFLNDYGMLYKITMEIYHGSGGRWERLADQNPDKSKRGGGKSG